MFLILFIRRIRQSSRHLTNIIMTIIKKSLSIPFLIRIQSYH